MSDTSTDLLANSVLELEQARGKARDARSERTAAVEKAGYADEHVKRRRGLLALVLAHRVTPYFRYDDEATRKSLELMLTELFDRLLFASDKKASSGDENLNAAFLGLSVKDINVALMEANGYFKSIAYDRDMREWQMEQQQQKEEERSE